MTTTCPECEAEITLQNVLRGEVVPCPDCGADLEVISVNPIVLEPAPVTEEDWGE